MQEQDFESFLKKVIGADVEELNDSVNQSIADEISKRTRIRLNEDSCYIKNSYDYFKKTPIHFINPKLPSDSFNDEIESYRVLAGLKSKSDMDSEVEGFLTENAYIDADLELTMEGEIFLSSIEWIGDYLIILDSFDFYEFKECLDNSENDFAKAALKFLNTHFNLALRRNDFKALFDVQSSKALYYVSEGDIEKGLAEELKLFIVRLNPNCKNSQLFLHEGVNQVNVLNLNGLIVACEIADIEGLFEDAWNSLDYEKLYFDKKKSFEILTDALATTDLDRINQNIEKAYFSK